MLPHERKTKGTTIKKLMNELGFQYESDTRRLSSYVGSFKSKLVSSTTRSLTGMYVELYEVIIEFTNRGYHNWDRIGFEWRISHELGQNAEFIDGYDGQGDVKVVIYQIRILKYRRNI